MPVVCVMRRHHDDGCSDYDRSPDPRRRLLQAHAWRRDLVGNVQRRSSGNLRRDHRRDGLRPQPRTWFRLQLGCNSSGMQHRTDDVSDGLADHRADGCSDHDGRSDNDGRSGVKVLLREQRGARRFREQPGVPCYG